MWEVYHKVMCLTTLPRCYIIAVGSFHNMASNSGHTGINVGADFSLFLSYRWRLIALCTTVPSED
jgi:hypothetical protein